MSSVFTLTDPVIPASDAGLYQFSSTPSSVTRRRAPGFNSVWLPEHHCGFG